MGENPLAPRMISHGAPTIFGIPFRGVLDPRLVFWPLRFAGVVRPHVLPSIDAELVGADADNRAVAGVQGRNGVRHGSPRRDGWLTRRTGPGWRGRGGRRRL